jgi:quaternary ammonium compound-resistance protein SugE
MKMARTLELKRQIYTIQLMSIAWIFLLLAGFFEICFTIALKYSQGFTKLIPSIITVIFIVLSFFSVSQAMKTISIGTAYAVWAGIGAAGTVLCGIFFFGDSYHIIRLISIFLIVIGIIGLKLANVE